jgi:hypothetical protein
MFGSQGRLVNDLSSVRRQGCGMAGRQENSDQMWAVIAPLFPTPKATGRPMMEVRSTVEGIA